MRTEQIIGLVAKAIERETPENEERHHCESCTCRPPKVPYQWPESEAFVAVRYLLAHPNVLGWMVKLSEHAHEGAQGE